MTTFRTMAAVAVAAALAGCGSDPAVEAPYSDAVGAEFSSDEPLDEIAVGVPAGTYAGGGRGGDLAPDDRLFMRRTTQDALEVNRLWQTSVWRNPRSGNAGSVTPTRTYRTADGVFCREFEVTLATDGDDADRALRAACRRADGTWRLVR